MNYFIILFCLAVFDEVTVGKFYASELIQEQYRRYHRKKKKHMEQTLSDLEAENAFKLQVIHFSQKKIL